MVAQKTSVSSSHEASNFAAYSNAIFAYFSFLFQWRKKRMRRWVMFWPFRFINLLKTFFIYGTFQQLESLTISKAYLIDTFWKVSKKFQLGNVHSKGYFLEILITKCFHCMFTVFIICNNIFIPVVWKALKTEVPVLIFGQKKHKLFCPWDITPVMKMKVIAACPMVLCDLCSMH